MQVLILILTYLIAVEHIGIMGLEMFASAETKAKAFDMPLDFVKLPNARVALANQGIYNGMLGAVIIMVNLLLAGQTLKIVLALLMLYIFIVALYGTFTATKKIFFLQGLPALITLLLILFF
ncbi:MULTISPECIES: DUF1304 domain-containing protein [Latilactobacillus]|uniref:DUF1304 domain-containing protein n=1 Tax=Latilactobacillus curvatus TaxID=28038 RepID=A0A0B2XJI0_LATCU|nr:DUF1304 domain-containing protein [Latilactobacillus curvatus]ANJ69634.1 hypothetical protein FBA2_06445 [Latilactobacillus curvatus]AOO75237.1 hypothetical protein LCW_03770 [Latilactobacillus curvatus]ASN62232.1 DUF1304 domain-containing protein [Latilactobacillus curvatus]AXN35594.1 DUF1304 domain-containing protein [Latilactobacillus curvatus]AZP96677.1 DUF1304 domain-containing protein [Latilactobacillus curvatus]